MADKFQNKYRVQSARLQKWNYGWQAPYFITICTENRIHYFGQVINKKMILSEIGRIAEQEWIKTFEMRPDMNLTMGEFVVMPNHFHGIVVIGSNRYNDPVWNDGNGDGRSAMHCASTPHHEKSQNVFGPQSKNLASVIRGFKIGVTKYARMITQEFAWQSGYHDHIIRDGKSYNRISNYIRDNPEKWKEDRFWNG